MTFQYAQIAQRLLNTPLLYDGLKAESFLEGLGSRIAGDTIVIANPAGAVDGLNGHNARPQLGRVGDRIERAYASAGRYPFDVVDGVAIISIEGTLVHKGAWVGASSGITSYQGLQAQIAMAEKSPAILGVVFEVDCFGGEVNGCFETAAAIARLSKLKPTISILTDYAFSGGYLLASQPRSIVMPRHGGAGSIGVLMIHADYSRKLDQDGVVMTIIRAGSQKALGNSVEPLPDDLREKWTAQAETIRGEFADAVVSGRKGRITKAKVMATEASTYNANEALELGLVDGIGDPIETFNAFVREVNRSKK